jgi:uncharacterized protein
MNIDSVSIAADLSAHGSARLGPLISPAQCESLMGGWNTAGLFRSTVVMKRHGFGSGEYKYFNYPLPECVQQLRGSLYLALAPVAQEWARRVGDETIYPATLNEFTARCRSAGQPKPTPLVLKYGPGDYNCLHQDLYGEVAFPLQVVIMLSPTTAYEGGSLLLVEQRPRMQSRGDALHIEQGHAVVFPNRYRPVQGTRGDYRVNVRHGVSTVTSGNRMTLGIIFHDAM